MLENERNWGIRYPMRVEMLSDLSRVVVLINRPPIAEVVNEILLYVPSTFSIWHGDPAYASVPEGQNEKLPLYTLLERVPF